MFFFFNDTATTEIYTLSLHDALPISEDMWTRSGGHTSGRPRTDPASTSPQTPGRASPSGHRSADTESADRFRRSEEHTSELQSQSNLVCRLLLEKTKITPRSGRPPLR